MFKRENRLSAGIRFNNSRSFSIPQFTLKIKDNGLLLNRFGIVVSKKIDGRSVKRNWIKRVFRSVLIDLNGNMAAGHDILFVARKEILNKTKEEILLLIKDSLRKAGILRMNGE